MTKQLKQFFNLKSYIPEFSLDEPAFFTLDINFNRELELHILALRKNNRQANRIITDIGNKSTIPNTLPSEENRTKRKQFQNITELTQIIPQLLPTNLPDKQLFSPPSLRKQATRNQQRPEIKYYGSNNDNNEEEKVEASKNKYEQAPSNFLKVPSNHIANQNQMNYLKIPSDSQVYFKNDGLGSDVYSPLGMHSPSNSSHPSLTDSYIVS